MKLRVLVIDDHDEARDTLATSLRREPSLAFFHLAASADEASTAISQGQPDIVLLDLHRRDGRGLETCRAVRRLTNAPILALASFMTPELFAPAKAAGVTDYVLKQIDTGALGRVLVRLGTAYRTTDNQSGQSVRCE